MAGTVSVERLRELMDDHTPTATGGGWIRCSCGSQRNYREHLIAVVVDSPPPAEAVMVLCKPDGTGIDRRCTIHRQWWPEGSPLCPEGARIPVPHLQTTCRATNPCCERRAGDVFENGGGCTECGHPRGCHA